MSTGKREDFLILHWERSEQSSLVHLLQRGSYTNFPNPRAERQSVNSMFWLSPFQNQKRIFKNASMTSRGVLRVVINAFRLSRRLGRPDVEEAVDVCVAESGERNIVKRCDNFVSHERRFLFQSRTILKVNRVLTEKRLNYLRLAKVQFRNW